MKLYYSPNLNPRVAVAVARTTNSPSPTTGLSVYAAHLPSFDNEEPEIVRHSS